MTRSINPIESVAIILHLHGMAFYGDSSFTLQVHIIQELLLRISFGNRAGYFQQSIGKGAFPMVDMGNNAKISNLFHEMLKYSFSIRNWFNRDKLILLFLQKFLIRILHQIQWRYYRLYAQQETQNK